MMWYLKQLFPLTYRTTFKDENGVTHYIVWNMFLGRCYNIDDVIVAGNPPLSSE